MARELSITLTPKQGVLTFFIVRIDDTPVIYNFATQTYTAEMEVDDQIVLAVEVFGVKGAKYHLSIDLPGEENDSTHSRTLGTHHDTFSQTL